MVRETCPNRFQGVARLLYGLTALWAAWLALQGHSWSMALLAACWAALVWPPGPAKRGGSAPSPHADRQSRGERGAELASARER